MKLLFDENLSPRLVQALEPAYPGSAHVRALGLRGATDGAIWELARQEAYAIISKDNDFRQLSFLHSAPHFRGAGADWKALGPRDFDAERKKD